MTRERKPTKREIAILPLVRRAVDAQIAEWQAEGDIERALRREINDVLGEEIKTLAVTANDGNDIQLADVRTFLEAIS